MRKIILIILFFSYQNSIAQQSEAVYLLFNSKSIETCNIPESEQGRYHGIKKIRKYEKIKQKNEEIDFYLCGELFTLYKKSKIDTCSIKHLKKIKFSNLWDLKRIVNEENALYPYKVFKKVYLVDRINDSTIVKYDVLWEYYVE